ncbi:hypothetical protein [Paenibacillus phytohabitans]|uniref:hypothetical protein n=1 Tax=Paenibacillus phytohabitans TaxID=2654978 RepID=UPI00300BDA34
MNKRLRTDLRAAAQNRERIIVKLITGDIIKGIAEPSINLSRVKIHTDEGPVWVPINDVEGVSRLLILRDIPFSNSN